MADPLAPFGAATQIWFRQLRRRRGLGGRRPDPLAGEPGRERGGALDQVTKPVGEIAVAGAPLGGCHRGTAR